MAASASDKLDLKLTVQYADERFKKIFPKAMVTKAVRAALFAPAEFTIRFVSAAEGRELNRDFRGKDYATNVLTFAYTEHEDAETTLADIVLCTDVLEREAAEQKKPLAAHAQHLIVHGVLHAQGYDHENDEEAQEMEQLETEILATLGLADPYL